MKLAAVGREAATVLAAVHAEAFDAPWSAADIASALAGPGAGALLACDDAAVGMIVFRAIAGEAEILTLAVSPRARRAGVGRALVAAAAGLAAQSGAETMFLEVAVDNAPAIALYAAAGFSEAGTRKAYYDRGAAGRVDALILRLDLNTASTWTYPKG